MIITTRRGIFSVLTISAFIHCTATGALIHHWDFNEGTGATAADSTGSNNASINGTVTWSTDTGDRANYLAFDGSNGSYLDPGLTYDPDGNYSWTVWARAADDADLNGIIVGNRRDGTTGGLGADFSPREFTKIQPTQVVFRPNDSANLVDYADLSVAAGWTHLAVVKSGSSITAYVNGVAEPSITLDNTFTVTAMPFFIGGDNTTRDIEFFEGDIDDVRIYDTALDQAGVVASMSPIPEPASALLGGLGALALLRRRRNRTSA